MERATWAGRLLDTFDNRHRASMEHTSFADRLLNTFDSHNQQRQQEGEILNALVNIGTYGLLHGLVPEQLCSTPTPLHEAAEPASDGDEIDTSHSEHHLVHPDDRREDSDRDVRVVLHSSRPQSHSRSRMPSTSTSSQHRLLVPSRPPGHNDPEQPLDRRENSDSDDAESDSASSMTRVSPNSTTHQPRDRSRSSARERTNRSREDDI